jgi:hypothetical protein
MHNAAGTYAITLFDAGHHSDGLNIPDTIMVASGARELD